jgi:hypothetical protein
MSDPVKETLDRFRQKEALLLGQLRDTRLTIKSLEQELGVQSDAPQTYDATSAPVDNGWTGEVDPVTVVAPVITRKPQFRGDEYFGMTHAEAARSYLKSVGHAVTFDELAEAMQAGGCKLSGANPKKVLYISLVRNTRDFVPPKPGLIGLRDFYPSGGRFPKEKKAKPSKAKARRVTANRKQTKFRKVKPKSRATAKDSSPQKPPSALAKTVMEIMSDKQSHSVDEIVEKAGVKAGSSVKKIGVVGVLRNKKFEKVDGRYRLVS